MKKRSSPPGSNVRIKPAGNHAADWGRIAKRVLRTPPPGIPCGDRADRYHVRDLVRHSDLEPECAEYWAAIYGKTAFIEATTLGAAMFEAARWDLTFATLWIAYSGAFNRVVEDWNAFTLIWHEGIWNGPKRVGQLLTRGEAEKSLWAGLQRGAVQAYAQTNAGRVTIPAIAWDTLKWVNAGPAQVVGHNSVDGTYRGVTVDAESVRKLPSSFFHPQMPKRGRGRPKGSGKHDAKDRQRLYKIDELVAAGTPQDSALWSVAEEADESVEVDSVKRRLQRKLQQRSTDKK